MMKISIHRYFRIFRRNFGSLYVMFKIIFTDGTGMKRIMPHIVIESDSHENFYLYLLYLLT